MGCARSQVRVLSPRQLNMKPQPWKLLSKIDVSLSKWFPVEKRAYELPSGRVVDDFYVSTFDDVSMVVPILNDGQIVLIRMYKQGADEVMIQFPAGRKEPQHLSMEETATHELQEETGIQVEESDLRFLGKFSTMSTKSTESVYLYMVSGVQVNSLQSLDENEEIELLMVEPQEVDKMIANGTIWCFQTIAAWHMMKTKFPELFA